jgi:hypothetical protein
VRAQTGFHADDARRKLLKSVFEAESSDPPPERNLATGAEPDKVKYLLADIHANDRRWRRVGLHRLHACFSCSTLLAVES